MLWSSAFLGLMSLLIGGAVSTDGVTSSLRGTEGRRLSSTDWWLRGTEGLRQRLSIDFTTCKELTINHTFATCLSQDGLKHAQSLPADTEVITFPNFTATNGSVYFVDCQGSRSFQFPKARILTELVVSGDGPNSNSTGCSVSFDELSQLGSLTMAYAVKMHLIANKLRRVDDSVFTDLRRPCISMTSLESTGDISFSDIVELSDCGPLPIAFPALKTTQNLALRNLGAQVYWEYFPALETALSVKLSNFAAAGFPNLTSVSGKLELACSKHAFCPDITVLTFPMLKFIGESLEVKDFVGLKTLSLPVLSVVNGAMKIESSQITALDIPVLGKVPSVEFTATHALRSLIMPELHDISSFKFSLSDGTQSISLPKVLNIGSVGIFANKALIALMLPLLKSCGSFEMTTTALPSLALPSLTVVRGLFRVQLNSRLTKLTFGKLSEVGGNFEVDWNGQLCIPVPPGVTVRGSTKLDSSCISGAPTSWKATPIVWMVLAFFGLPLLSLWE